ALAGPLPRIDGLDLPDRYIVVHPGASVPARRMSVPHLSAVVDALQDEGHPVVVTGSDSERDLTAALARDRATDLGGRTTLDQLAAVIDSAEAVVAPNTGTAHLSAAV